MDITNSKKSSIESFSPSGLALMTTCFLAGIYIGRKMTNTVRRVSSILSVGPSKLALVVRTDLNMQKGKIASQCSHGTLLAYQVMQRSNPRLLQAWTDTGQQKVVLRAESLDQLRELAETAKSIGVQEVLVRDAGKTQVAEGSETVLAVGPATISDVDKITGKLRLL